MSKNTTAGFIAWTIITIVGAGFVGVLWGGGIPLLADKQMNVFEQQASLEAMKQFNMVVKAKRPYSEQCVYASILVASLIQAEDSVTLAKVAPIEKNVCATAGIPK